MKGDFVRSILYFSCLKLTEGSAEKLAALPADMMLLDLEDAVPAAERVNARQRLSEHFTSLRRKLKRIAVRINAVHTTDGIRDLLFIGEHGLQFDMVLVPMVEDAQEIRLVRSILRESGLSPAIFALIETPGGVEEAPGIAAECDGLFYGGADYCASIGIDIAKGGTSLIEYATSKIVNAAAMHGIPSFDTPCFKMNDLLYLEEESDAAFRQGFAGKQAIHPQQLPIINQIFTQPESRIEWAREILEATNQGNQRIVKVNDTMVGPPFAKLAKKIVASAGDERAEKLKAKLLFEMGIVK